MELLKENGFDGLAEAVTLLMNEAMLVQRSEYLCPRPYEHSATRVGHANGFEDKAVKSRLGVLPLEVSQT